LLQKIPADVGFVPKQSTFWTTAFGTVFASSLIFVNFWAAVGLGNTVGFGPAETSPLINPMLQIFLVSSGLLGFILATFIFDWRRKKLAPQSLKHLALYSAMAYLVCIFAMAFFRFQIVDEIITGII
jgi:predicted membrane protein